MENKYIQSFELKSNPTDVTYKQLLNCMFVMTDTFILVERDQIEDSDNMRVILKELLPFELAVKYQSSFAGTLLGDGLTAKVHYYKCHQSAKEILTDYSNSLYEWLQPNLPEDLSFIKNNLYILSNTAHENRAVIFLHEPVIYKEILKIKGIEGKLVEIHFEPIIPYN